MIYCIYCFITETLLNVFNDPTVTSVLTITYKISEFFYFSLIAYLLLYNQSLLKVLKIGSVIYAIVVISCFMYYDLKVLYSIVAGFTAIFLFSYSILVMFDWISLTPLDPIYERPAFWILLGFLIYEAGNYFNFIIQDVYQYKAINLHSIFSLIRNIFFLTTIVIIHFKNKRLMHRLNQIKY
ncbi:hypothetical protein [Gynurincola endophyticus]|uniref:hypothetical protein n=1 Tax=Gynurincola endophyticus TaxID=2479004 RepID=UPI000F8CFE01|nr:hypothetical protein [Gynurincola endophyticus]